MKTKLAALVVLIGLFFASESAGQRLDIFVEGHEGAYPSMPFDVKGVLGTEFDRVDIWREVYKRGADDESGMVWSEQVDNYQTFSAILGDKKLQNVTYYGPNNVRLRRLDYYYINGAISAIDEMGVDEAGGDDLQWTNVFFYESDGRPFQRVRMYPKDKGFREITAFRFDAKGRLVHQKTSYTGTPRHAQTLLRVQTGKELITTEFEAKTVLQNTYQNYNEIIVSNEYVLASDKEVATLRAYGPNNRLQRVANYTYTDGKLTKIEAELHNVANAQPEHVGPRGDAALPTEIIYYFYNAQGLVERIIVEQGQQQIVYNYNYLTR